jgi:DNA replication protein DnaC
MGVRRKAVPALMPTKNLAKKTTQRQKGSLMMNGLTGKTSLAIAYSALPKQERKSVTMTTVLEGLRLLHQPNKGEPTSCPKL